MTTLAVPRVYVESLPILTRTHTIGLIGKGGSGKSTLSANLAAAAVKFGLRAGILDADPQGSTTLWRSLRPKADVAVDRCASLERVKRTIEKARAAKFDLLFIDTAAAADGLAREILGLTDQNLIVSRPTTFDANVAQDHIAYCRAINAHWHLVLNACPPTRNGVVAPVVQDFRDCFSAERRWIWRGQITESQMIPQTIAMGKGVVEVVPEKKVSEEYSALLKAVTAFARRMETTQ